MRESPKSALTISILLQVAACLQFPCIRDASVSLVYHDIHWNNAPTCNSFVRKFFLIISDDLNLRSWDYELITRCDHKQSKLNVSKELSARCIEEKCYKWYPEHKRQPTRINLKEITNNLKEIVTCNKVVIQLYVLSAISIRKTRKHLPVRIAVVLKKKYSELTVL